MPSRRATIALLAAAAASPALGQGADRPNPMPAELREALERDRNAVVLGNPDGNVTLTEFFDYNCPFCKKLVPAMQRLIGSDPQLRVVFREWPVFGEGSDFAARAALAAREQGKYWQVHAGLMAMKDRAAEPSVMRVVRRLGLDEAKLREAMQSDPVEDHIARSFMLADHMSLIGTPTLIAGDEALFGDQSFEDLTALVARARKTLGVAAG
ncbi:DsbA family protein [Paracoccus salipaludis]|uniref:Fis family transcriptional regulator n=1 Tax=Paracoccus salipaludis TaxID=2032623 RepID=A0A2A2GNX4_9RHOB|nr:DsbA family protein [Paracoccus salipaludis]PAU98673.1 Fis family transcriptional regulator [Paracoccus salipaludis]